MGSMLERVLLAEMALSFHRVIIVGLASGVLQKVWVIALVDCDCLSKVTRPLGFDDGLAYLYRGVLVIIYFGMLGSFFVVCSCFLLWAISTVYTSHSVGVYIGHCCFPPVLGAFSALESSIFEVFFRNRATCGLSSFKFVVV